MNKIKSLLFKDVLGSDTKILVFLFISAFIIRVLVMANTDFWIIGEDDAITRTSAAYLMFEWKSFQVKDVFRLPLHSYIMAVFMYFHSNPIIAARLASLFFGLAGILVFFKLTSLMFGRKIGIYSALVLTFFSFHVYLSVAPLTEATYIFFLMNSVLFLKLHSLNKKQLLLILSSISLGLSCMIRYESWLLILPFVFYIRLRLTKSFLPVLTFLSIASFFPLCWLLWNWLSTDNPFTFALPDIILRYPGNYNKNSFFENVLYWPKILVSHLGFIGSILALYGLVVSLFRRSFIFSIFLVLFFFLIPFIGTLTGIVGMSPTYIFTSEVFLIPFIVFGATLVAELYNPQKTASFIIGLLLLFFCVNTTNIFINNPKDIDFKTLVDYLVENKGDSSNFLVSRRVFTASNKIDMPRDLLVLYLKIRDLERISVAEDMEDSYFNLLGSIKDKTKLIGRIEETESRIKEQLESIMVSDKPEFAIFSKKDRCLPLFVDILDADGDSYNKRLVVDTAKHSVYRISYNKKL